MEDDDLKLLRGFADGRTDGRTDEQTFVIVESLSRLKKLHQTTTTHSSINNQQSRIE